MIATTLLGQANPDQLSPIPDLFSTSGTYQEILDFLIARPTSEQIINFKVSQTAQNRLQALLQKNREVALTPTETAELDLYEKLDTLLGFLKVRANTALGAPLQNE